MHFWPRQRESISMKTSMGLKLRIFNATNLSTSMVSLTGLELTRLQKFLFILATYCHTPAIYSAFTHMIENVQ